MMVNKNKNKTASLIGANNDAIVYLKMGNLKEAYSVLSEAVADLQRLTQEQPPKRTPFRFKFRWTDLTDTIADCVFKSSEHQNGLLFLFQRCLTIDMPRKREIWANTLCPYGICFILHYNLAVVAHLIGIQKGDRGLSYLRQANRLYGMVSAHVVSRRGSADYTAVHVVLLMGIWNNQGRICMELGMEELAAKWLDRLTKLVMSTRVSRNKLPGWWYFYLNLVTTKTQRLVAAAAWWDRLTCCFWERYLISWDNDSPSRRQPIFFFFFEVKTILLDDKRLLIFSSWPTFVLFTLIIVLGCVSSTNKNCCSQFAADWGYRLATANGDSSGMRWSMRLSMASAAGDQQWISMIIPPRGSTPRLHMLLRFEMVYVPSLWSGFIVSFIRFVLWHSY